MVGKRAPGCIAERGLDLRVFAIVVSGASRWRLVRPIVFHLVHHDSVFITDLLGVGRADPALLFAIQILHLLFRLPDCAGTAALLQAKELRNLRAMVLCVLARKGLAD